MKIREAYKIIGGLCGHDNRKAKYLCLFKFNNSVDQEAYPGCEVCAISWKEEIARFNKWIEITPALEFALKLNFSPLGKNCGGYDRRVLVAKFARSFCNKSDK